MTELNCVKCGHVWNYKGTKPYVHCSSCYAHVNVGKVLKEKRWNALVERCKADNRLLPFISEEWLFIHPGTPVPEVNDDRVRFLIIDFVTCVLNEKIERFDR